MWGSARPESVRCFKDFWGPKSQREKKNLVEKLFFPIISKGENQKVEFANQAGGDPQSGKSGIVRQAGEEAIQGS